MGDRDNDIYDKITRLRYKVAREKTAAQGQSSPYRDVPPQSSGYGGGFGYGGLPAISMPMAGPSTMMGPPFGFGGSRGAPDPLSEVASQLEEQNRLIQEEIKKKRQLVRKLKDLKRRKEEEEMCTQMEQATRMLSDMVADRVEMDELSRTREAKPVDPQTLQLQLMTQLVEQNKNLQGILENGGSFGRQAGGPPGAAPQTTKGDQAAAAEKVKSLQDKLKKAMRDGSDSNPDSDSDADPEGSEDGEGKKKTQKSKEKSEQKKKNLEKWLDDDSEEDYTKETKKLQEELADMRKEKVKERKGGGLNKYATNKKYPLCKRWRRHCMYIVFCYTLINHMRERERMKESRLGEIADIIVSNIDAALEFLVPIVEVPVASLLSGTSTLEKGRGDLAMRIQVRVRTIVENLEKATKMGLVADRTKNFLNSLTVEGALVPAGFLLESEKKYVKLSKDHQLMGMTQGLKRRLIINFLLVRCMLMRLFNRPWDHNCGPKKVKSKAAIKDMHMLGRAMYTCVRTALGMCSESLVQAPGGDITSARYKLEAEDPEVTDVIDSPSSKEVLVYQDLSEWITSIAKRILKWSDEVVEYQFSQATGPGKHKRA